MGNWQWWAGTKRWGEKAQPPGANTNYPINVPYLMRLKEKIMTFIRSTNIFQARVEREKYPGKHSQQRQPDSELASQAAPP